MTGLYRDWRRWGKSEAQGLERLRVGGVMRNAEKSLNSVTGAGDAEKDWWSMLALICYILNFRTILAFLLI